MWDNIWIDVFNLELVFGDERETNDVEEDLTQAKPEPNVTFPNMPNIIIDLTENDDLIRNVIAFSGSDQEKELDRHLN